jgi:hypothetical protein
VKIVIDGALATVEARPNAAILALLPSLEGRRTWLNSGGLRIEASQHNINVFRGTFPDLEIEDASSLANDGQDVASEFDLGRSPYEMKTKPYPHQIRALEKARTRAAFALFMEQGTGKTKVAIDRAGELHAAGLIDAILVVAKKGVHRQWVESELPAHANFQYAAAFWPTKKRQLPEELLGPGPLKVFTINFDGAKSKDGERLCTEFVTAHRGRVLIVGDETQEIKTTTTGRWKAMDRITKAARTHYRLALTGTPIAKDVSDEWAQLKWLNEDILGIRYITAFRNEYCVMGGFEGRAVIGQKNMDRFRAKVDPFTFRATKEEIGILPKAYRRWEFDLAPAQKAAINEIRRTLEHQIETGELVSAANAAVALSKVQQISNGFAIDEDGDIHPIGPEGVKNPRMEALMEVLNAYEGPTIVWARFKEDMRRIAATLNAAGETFVEYHGSTPDKVRAENVQKFLRGEARVFLANPQSAGTGLNLQTGGCTHAIYYSNSYNAIDRWQSEDRIHRIGTIGAVVYTDLIAKGAMDKPILTNLRRKKGISELALGDIQQILREDLL